MKRVNSRGIALLVTVAILSAVVAVSLEMNRRSRSAATRAVIEQHRTTLSAMASSGVQAAMAILIRDKAESEIDSIQEAWANPDIVRAVVAELAFETGELSVAIQDEQAKIQVNALVQGPGRSQYNESQRLMWDRFLRVMHARLLPDERSFEPDEVICALKDWMDSEDDDALSCPNGAESDYYKGLTPPYPCRNGPIPHIGELMRIRGITANLFYGLPNEKGISDYITAYRGEDAQSLPTGFAGKININTAEQPVLAAMLPSGKEELAQALVDYRVEMSESKYIHDLSLPTWYKQVAGLQGVVIDPRLITLSSDLFRIRASARMDHLSVTATALVHRENDPATGKCICRVLTWLVE
ncbi:MAG: type II secretion system minor pseudopilin GspK [Deltaproteobacteria bacterium]|nr:type II secretion system minor pseudopilin GspK [Deltaproteobacteria bacterium]